MSGSLFPSPSFNIATIFSQPVATTDATNKAYVDAQTGAIGGPFLPLAGGAVTGSTSFASGGSLSGNWAGNPTFAGSVTHSTTTLLNGQTTVGTDAAAATLISNGQTGSRRQMLWRTASSTRFRTGLNTTAESGSNVGADWDTDCFSDAGANLFTATRVTRSTGRFTVFKGLSIGSGTWVFDGTAQTSITNQPIASSLTFSGNLAAPSGSSGLHRFIFTDNGVAAGPTGFQRAGLQFNYGPGAGSVGAGGAFDIRGNDVGTTGDRAAGQAMSTMAIRATGVMNFNQGGTSATDPWGHLWGCNLVANANTGATFLAAVRGVEINFGLDTGSSAVIVEGLKITQAQDNSAALTPAGTVFIAVGGGAASTVQPQAGIRFGTHPDVNWTFGSASNVIDSSGFGNNFPASAGSQQDAWYVNSWGVDHQKGFALAYGSTGPLILDANASQIGTGRFVASSAGLSLDVTGAYGTGTPTVAAGGSGYVIGDRLFYGNGGVAQVATVSAGAVLTVRVPIRQPYLNTTSTPGNPLATTTDYKSTGTGCTLNVSWVTTAVGLSIQPTAGGKLGFFGATPAVKSTGWVAMTGTPDTGSSFATSTVTLAQLAGRVMSIQAQLTTLGLLNA